jgi:hypothetical protein
MQNNGEFMDHDPNPKQMPNINIHRINDSYKLFYANHRPTSAMNFA